MSEISIRRGMLKANGCPSSFCFSKVLCKITLEDGCPHTHMLRVSATTTGTLSKMRTMLATRSVPKRGEVKRLGRSRCSLVPMKNLARCLKSTVTIVTTGSERATRGTGGLVGMGCRILPRVHAVRRTTTRSTPGMFSRRRGGVYTRGRVDEKGTSRTVHGSGCIVDRRFRAP